MFRFSIRNVLWLMVLVGLGCGWWLEHRRAAQTAAKYHAVKTHPRDHLKTYWVLRDIIPGAIVLPEDGAPPPSRWEPVWDKPAKSP